MHEQLMASDGVGRAGLGQLVTRLRPHIDRTSVKIGATRSPDQSWCSVYGRAAEQPGLNQNEVLLMDLSFWMLRRRWCGERRRRRIARARSEQD